ncbi:maleylpyruvate isomerase family mycothiol-dependent enzyme [Arthrobacter tecti]
MKRATTMRLARNEYARVADAVVGRAPEQWSLPTDCPKWDVRELVAHICGMAAMAATPWETNRQVKAADKEVARTGVAQIDALTGLQVSERANKTPEELTAELRLIGPKAARGRRLTPFFIRNRRLPEEQSMDGVSEWWTIGYLLDVVLTRDPWMHRIDLSRATGNQLALTADHDCVIVDDVVREWASRHGKPYRLTLTGPAGGTWSAYDDGEHLELDAIEFCRILSGRAPGEGLLKTMVPF